MKRIIYVCDICGHEIESDSRPRLWRTVEAGWDLDAIILVVIDGSLVWAQRGTSGETPIACSAKCYVDAIRRAADLVGEDLKP